MALLPAVAPFASVRLTAATIHLSAKAARIALQWRFPE